MNKSEIQDKKIKNIVKGSLVLAVILPIFINILMFLGFLPVAGDDKTWISTLCSLWGAIVGGLISGAITYYGVRITIESSENGILKTLDEQQKIREEEIYIQSSKERLFNLYHPLDAKFAIYAKQYGADDFSDLSEEEKNDYWSILNEGIVYGDRRMFERYLELGWSFKENSGVDTNKANQIYYEINEMVTDEVKKLREIIKLPKLYY